MTVHPQFADDLAIHSLGLLEGTELQALDEHLRSCEDCRSELAQFRADAALLALTITGAAPPERARTRLLNAIQSTPQGAGYQATPLKNVNREVAKQEFTAPLPLPFVDKRDVRAALSSTWTGMLGWAVAAVLLIGTVVLITQNSKLRRNVETAKDQAAQQDIRVRQAEQLVSILTAPDAVRSTLVSTKSQPQPQGKAFYQRNAGQLVFIASNLPTLPPNKAYELWLIPDVGAPMNAGVFTTDARGNGSLVNSQLPVGITAKTFAITVENVAGSPVPTSPILIAGAAGI